jgi:hypothetical protein
MTTTSAPPAAGNGAALVPHTPAPSRTGQATAVEQSRAVAEVEAAIVVALRHPRDITRAVADMRRSCGQKSLAERAFFRFPRAGQTISGPSVQLARELARCWGNFQSGITELRRDDDYGQSEMQAWAWDVQTNTRTSTVFIVPHLRDKRGGPERLTDARDIYENNANMGARRLREMILATLPGWFVEDAIAACYETLADDGGAPLADRITKALAAFAELGVTQAQIEQKFGAPLGRWTAYDLAQLQVIYRSLVRGEIRKEDEFGTADTRVTAGEIISEPEPASPAGPAAAAPGDRQQNAPKTALAKLDKLLGSLQLGTGEDVAALLEWLCGEPYAASRSHVQLVTSFLEDHLRACQGDTAEAASAIWAQFRAVNEQDAAEAGDAPGGEPGGE